MTPANAVNAIDDFNIPVTMDELDAKPTFLMPNGWYTSTLQSGAELKSNDSGWQGIRVPFSGFTSKKDGKVFEKDRAFQITVASTNEQAKTIGRQQLTALAVAFGLAEDTTVGGKPAKKLIAKSPEEFVEQLNSVAGSPADVYITTKNRKRDGKVVMRNDNSGPMQDNEISRVAEFGKGK